MASEEQIIYEEIIKLITENKLLTINGTPMTLNEASNYITNLQQENKQLKERIESADEFCDRYMGVKLELFDMYELLNKIREILGDKK